MKVGLNPYGLTYTLGLQGAGGPRANPAGSGLDGFMGIVADLGAQVVEIFDPWLRALSDHDLARLSDRIGQAGLVPVVSAGINMMGPMDSAFRSARALGAHVIRLGLTPVLCGARAEQGARWDEMGVMIRQTLAEWGPRARDDGRWIAIENHQDFGSAELVALCEEFEGIAITYDTGNSFPVLESPLDFTARVAPHVRHMHLKDYRVQFTPQGYQLVRCAIGDGAVPMQAVVAMVEAASPEVNAVLEPGALEARHVRFLEPQWWTGYAPKSGEEVARCLAAAQVNSLHQDADCRTPWETGDDNTLAAWEGDMIRRSAANMQSLGIWERT